MGLLETIKKAGLQGMDSTNPVTILFGDVTSVNPLEIKVDQRFNLTSEFLVLAETVTPIRVGLKERDKVMAPRLKQTQQNKEQ